MHARCRCGGALRSSSTASQIRKDAYHRRYRNGTYVRNFPSLFLQYFRQQAATEAARGSVSL
jgi:hypothetical protein